jgi:S-adenosylmethionine/arginine decarboxylase-like enzyme
VDKESVRLFLKQLVEEIKMEPVGEPILWDEMDAEEINIAGVSGLQWIRTSNIVIHTLTKTRLALINIFSCREFDAV